MTIEQPFVMEAVMGEYEQNVEFNLSESGVHPVQLRELLGNDPARIGRLLDTDLNYPYVNGIPELRQNIASLYNGAHPDNVLVTVGAIEANYIATRTLLSPGDEIVTMLPNYLQIWGVARNHDYRIKTFTLQEEKGWAPDLDELEDKVSADTKVIALCNPNNPTGYILTEKEMDRIVTLADRVGAWIIADEVYRGVERVAEPETPSFYGRYDRVIAVGSMSKAYGLPGLRVGWTVGPQDILDEFRRRQEYITICATMLSNHLAALALSPEVRPGLIARARQYIRTGYPILEQWMDGHKELFTCTPPQAAAIAFVRYHLDINSTQLMERLAKEKRVLIVPGDHFNMDHFVRISFGLAADYLTTALDRFHDLLGDMAQ
jgi:aspartate/methionine/tyrosine aminotransferase